MAIAAESFPIRLERARVRSSAGARLCARIPVAVRSGRRGGRANRRTRTFETSLDLNDLSVTYASCDSRKAWRRSGTWSADGNAQDGMRARQR